MNKKTKSKKDLDGILEDILQNGPAIKSYTIDNLKEILNELRSCIRGWHFERLPRRRKR